MQKPQEGLRHNWIVSLKCMAWAWEGGLEWLYGFRNLKRDGN